MKPVIAVDVAFLAIPNHANSSAEVESILSNVNAWASLAENQNCCRFAISSTAIDTLESSNCFPATHNIQELLELHQLEHVFSARDVNSRIFSLINRAHRLVEAFDLEVVECVDNSAPEVDTSGASHPALTDSMFCLMATIAASTNPEMVAILLGFPFHSSPVTYSGGFVMGYDINNAIILHGPPLQVASPITATTTPKAYLSGLDAALLWQHAEDEVQLHLAITLEAIALKGVQIDAIPSQNCTGFCIGTDFRTSLAQHCADGAGNFADVVREKCAQAVIAYENLNVKDFSETRATDKASAFRVHLTKRHQALRLMFWRKPSGRIEFANVGNKAELKIVAGNSAIEHCSKFDC